MKQLGKKPMMPVLESIACDQRVTACHARGDQNKNGDSPSVIDPLQKKMLPHRAITKIRTLDALLR
jgi:hypothetical protein